MPPPPPRQQGPSFLSVLDLPEPLRREGSPEARLEACLAQLLPSRPAAALPEIIARTRIRSLPAGGNLSTSTDDVTAAMVLKARLAIRHDDQDLRLGPGSMLHARSLLQPRRFPACLVAKVRALRPSRIALLPRDLLHTLASASPALAAELVARDRVPNIVCGVGLGASVARL